MRRAAGGRRGGARRRGGMQVEGQPGGPRASRGPRTPSRATLPTLAFAAALLLHATAARAAGDGEGALQLFPELSELIPLLLLFLLLIPVTDHLLFRPIFRVLDAREDRIAGARRRAQRLDADAAAVIERYQRAVTDVKDEAERARKELAAEARQAHAEQVAEARAEAEGRVEAARAELGSALESARRDLRGEAEQLAREAAQRILGRSLA